MKFPSYRAFGAITMLSLIAALVVAQAPAPSPDPAWYRTRIFGQSIQVFATKDDRGILHWSRDWRDDQRIAPAEAERRKAVVIDQRPLVTPSPQSPRAAKAEPLNYGVNVEELRGDGRTIRASDAETLAKVTAQAASRCEVHGLDKCPNGGGCKPEPEKPRHKPGIIEWAKIEVEKLLTYAVAAIVVLAAVVLIVQSKPKT